MFVYSQNFLKFHGMVWCNHLETIDIPQTALTIIKEAKNAS